MLRVVTKCVVRLSHKPRHTGCQTNVYSIFKSWHNVHLFSSKAVIYHKHFSSLLTHSHDTVEQSQLRRIYSQLKASIFIILYFGDVCMHVTGFTLARGRDTSKYCAGFNVPSWCSFTSSTCGSHLSERLQCLSKNRV